MSRTVRKPTGQVHWPIILLAGIEGSGKTWAAAQATGGKNVGDAYFIEVGESSADEYAAVPGANYSIVEHDGSFDDILAATEWAAAQPAPEGRYNMLIIDSVTEVWTLLSDEAQHMANRRRYKGRGSTGDAQITMDLWNTAKARIIQLWQACRKFPGPVIVTARLENVTIVSSDGKPTGEREWKVRCQKDTPFYAQAIVQARRPQEFTLTKIASTRLQLAPGGEMALPDFTIEALLDNMGVGVSTTSSTYVDPDPTGQAGLEKTFARLAEDKDVPGLRELWKTATARGHADLAERISQAAKALAQAPAEPPQEAEAPAPPDRAAVPA
ncbi:hypothetical protein C1Y63_04965 [Corynebacterium sp. 13CS0277]|uniref:AAA family ATPase n=1 Tax=Corynebacterium sp. 13CS0277 TaxID=2071994 RepID=UPI000D024A67|nr:AAA family ATPase [Corynebacterium sp. 13CS0277]PRQ11763.1 hypothetical protein C1Y63_04965 [Corynebacterium sp. 13CS0277]